MSGIKETAIKMCEAYAAECQAFKERSSLGLELEKANGVTFPLLVQTPRDGSFVVYSSGLACDGHAAIERVTEV